MDNKTNSIWQALIVVALATMSFNALAQDSDSRSLGLGVTETMIVPVFKSGVLRLEEPAARISVGNPDVADILILRATQLYVLGKDIGTTNVILWDRSDNLIGTVEVEVTHDLQSLKAKLYKMLPNDEIMVNSSQRNILLSGQVSNTISMEAAIRIAEGYLTQISTSEDTVQFELDEGSSTKEDKSVGEVINLMVIGGGQQVMLEVKVAEISRTELRSIEAKMQFISSSTRWSIGGVNGGATFSGVDAGASLFETGEWVPNDLDIVDKGIFTSFLSDDFLFNMALNIAKENGLAKILAEPTLTTLTGQQAEFLSGGEFPIPVAQEEGRTTIEFKEFGVGLKFLPVVLGDGIINLKVDITVSELAQQNNVFLGSGFTSTTFVVPGLTKRSAQATYELRDGQTIAVAGLINENLREVVNKIPGLGDLPILGALFRSQDYIKGETELMILITPRLARPIDPSQLTLPTDSFVEPSDMDFYLLGRMEGSASHSSNDEGGTDGDFGHQVQ